MRLCGWRIMLYILNGMIKLFRRSCLKLNIKLNIKYFMMILIYRYRYIFICIYNTKITLPLAPTTEDAICGWCYSCAECHVLLINPTDKDYHKVWLDRVITPYHNLFDSSSMLYSQLYHFSERGFYHYHMFHTTDYNWYHGHKYIIQTFEHRVCYRGVGDLDDHFSCFFCGLLSTHSKLPS